MMKVHLENCWNRRKTKARSLTAEVTLQKLRCCIPREVDHRASIGDGRILAVDVYPNIDGTVEGILDEIYQQVALLASPFIPKISLKPGVQLGS